MPELNRKDLKQQINRKEFDNIYLIFGEEKMYVRLDTEYLIEKLMGRNPSEFNYHSFVWPCGLDDVAVAVQILPFTDKYNCVRLADVEINSLNKDELEQLVAVISNVPDTTVLILTMPTLEQDMKKPGAAFTKVRNLVKKNGTVCVEERETDISLARQIIRWADKRNIKIEQADAYKLQEYAGDDLNVLKNELDKLCNYVGDGAQITGEHIELLVPKRLEANIFYLADAVVAGNSDRAFSILDALFYQKAEPESIISVLSMAYIDFYRARVSAESGVPMKDTAAEFNYGKRGFALSKANSKTRRMPIEALRDSLDAITDAVADLHSSSLDKRAVLEKLVAELLIFASKR